ncbi:hypothetical protein [Bosea sp. 47.2.35]|uniref:hypothetical protein n=1 Tax=Bosea sp. 47.2.35 TaxID=2969304 RepID=UPI00214F715D|nr:hypothetical protein [Bosea sp. 47.2.35]MCR4520280.1 hypothetical protein [Bosea sp. 47.2.35]
MTIIIIGLLIIGAVWFFKNNTRRGAETVRAYVYLNLIESGVDKLLANHAVLHVMNVEPDVIRSAKLAVARVYGGKQIPMIADAYLAGMLPQLSPGTASRIVQVHRDRRVAGAGIASAEHVRPAPDNKTNTAAVIGENESDFSDYYRQYVDALKLRDGKSKDEFHVVELMEDEPIRRAFRDGVSVETLVKLYTDHYAKRQA